MTVFREPDLRARTVIAAEYVPALTSSNDVDYLCGGCDVVLAEGFAPGQLQLLGFRCWKCKAYSEVPPEKERPGGGVDLPVGIYRLASRLGAIPGRTNVRGHLSDA